MLAVVVDVNDASSLITSGGFNAHIDVVNDISSIAIKPEIP